jgi:hypothetical protein
MRVLLIILAVLALAAPMASAQLMMTGYGPGSAANSTPAVTCGSGVIDLSTGCTTNMMLGLGP